MRSAPDYAGLVKLLPVLRNLVDACGEVTLTPQEAELIRSLGFAVKAGRWRVPPVPPELVADNPLLEHLSLGWVPPGATFRDLTNHREEALNSPHFSRVPGVQDEQFPLTKLQERIVAKLNRHGGCPKRRTIQQRCWRTPATAFNHALQALLDSKVVKQEGSFLCVAQDVTHTADRQNRSLLEERERGLADLGNFCRSKGNHGSP